MSYVPFNQQPGQGSLSGLVLANGSSVPSAIKVNYSASANPSTANDNTQGYVVGSHWIDTTHNTVWTAVSVATGAAVWVQNQAAGADGYSEVTLSNINLTLQKGVNNKFIDYSGTLSGAVTINLIRSGAVAGDVFYIRFNAVAGLSGTNTLTIQENGSGSLVAWNQTTTAFTRGIKAIFNGTAWELWDVAYPLDAGTNAGDTLYFDGSNWVKLPVGAANTVLVSSGSSISWGKTIGTSANNIVALDGSSKLPAVDGSQLTNLPSTGSIPSGAMLDYGGASAPSGWLLCDGSAVSRSTYSSLFTAIGTAFGTGDGSTTFNVPDFRGRVAVGSGAGSGLTSRTLASTGGEETHALTESELASHYHTFTSGGTGGGSTQARNIGTGADASFNTSSSGSGTGHNNMQPFLVATKIIKT